MPAQPDPSRAERVLNGRAGALKQWSQIPRAQRPAGTEAAREGWLRKLETQIDPGGKLDPGERRQLALQARRAVMVRMAAKSAKARRLRREAKAHPAPAPVAQPDPPPVSDAGRDALDQFLAHLGDADGPGAA